MSRTGLLYRETKNMLVRVKDAPESDELIQAIEDFFEKREGLIKEIKPPLSEEEKLELQQVVDMEPLIMTELKRLQQDVKKELVKAKQKRAMHHSYINPYQNMTIDGTYYDKRK
ncbi:flagellar protein FliT [Bacillus swezeyi]|uniref:Flagellar protein FliT n=1 Tax=Bacillus swezeyi TaxID=1925020 RepID=A0A1R1RYC4_9BACI|nr:flagellar protein FliT [Bacillus swezeyi]KAA6450810.1 flagellar protein FliT [Bacillus swezeyi]KAA6474989.1 flagellar protein FliT [Bacillus swezeyi]MEC1259434.1 flagellar protein FliT [Bacillus swezeyi]MED2927604.1 flagellar protein FliT [Bacillus swezeyi]MED2941862.1 flagellar protein FliT [Bacillus swezeyi]